MGEEYLLGERLWEKLKSKIMQRFRPPNATHYYGRIQDFLAADGPIPYQFNNLEYFAICNYVPDPEARRMVRERFQNCFCFYPCGVV